MAGAKRTYQTGFEARKQFLLKSSREKGEGVLSKVQAVQTHCEAAEATSRSQFKHLDRRLDKLSEQVKELSGHLVSLAATVDGSLRAKQPPQAAGASLPVPQRASHAALSPSGADVSVPSDS